MRQEGPQLISEMIRKTLNIDCCVMMGANIAGDIASRRESSVWCHQPACCMLCAALPSRLSVVSCTPQGAQRVHAGVH